MRAVGGCRERESGGSVGDRPAPVPVGRGQPGLRRIRILLSMCSEGSGMATGESWHVAERHSGAGRGGALWRFEHALEH